MSKPYGGRIENWYVNTLGSISGNLYDDPRQRFNEGAFIDTSYVVKLDEELANLETRNTVYDIGEKDLETSAIYEAAIASLQKDGYDPKYIKSVTGLID